MCKTHACIAGSARKKLHNIHAHWSINQSTCQRIDKSEKKAALKNFEQLSFSKNQSQLFIETPYRNNKLLEDVLQTLQPNTLLCIACDLTLPTEYIKTLRVADWKKTNIDLHNRPAIFIIHKNY